MSRVTPLAAFTLADASAILEELYEKSVNLLMDVPTVRYYPHDKGWLELPVKAAVEPVN